MRQWLEPKVSQLAPGSMSEFALNLKPVRSSGPPRENSGMDGGTVGTYGQIITKKTYVRFSITPLEMHFALEERCFSGVPPP